jgi:hypothetical protein
MRSETRVGWRGRSDLGDMDWTTCQGGEDESMC